MVTGLAAVTLALILGFAPTYLPTGTGECIPDCNDYPTNKHRDIKQMRWKCAATTLKPLTAGVSNRAVIDWKSWITAFSLLSQQSSVLMAK